MSDRELLELAAKAAGIEVHWVVGLEPETGWFATPAGVIWEPLDDDGDALRLAVKLGIQPIFQNGKVFTGYERTEKYEKPIFESLTGDQYGATRRAIVRAAAALGESK